VHGGQVYDDYVPDPSVGPDGMTDAERVRKTGSVHPTVGVASVADIPDHITGTAERLEWALSQTKPGSPNAIDPVNVVVDEDVHVRASVKDAPEYDPETGVWQSPEARFQQMMRAANERAGQ
jgi:hypothetical protein